MVYRLRSGRNWLLNSHECISIQVNNDEEAVEVPSITKVQLLKVRGVE